MFFIFSHIKKKKSRERERGVEYRLVTTKGGWEGVGGWYDVHRCSDNKLFQYLFCAHDDDDGDDGGDDDDESRGLQIEELQSNLRLSSL